MIKHARMTRSRLYVLIDSFESDLRRILIRYILDHLPENEALGPNFKRANDRREADGGDTDVSIAEYLDLRECYDILNRHRDSLPGELSRELRANTVHMDSLVPIRNRVMHGRPLQEGDAENAVSATNSFTSRFWQSARDTLEHLYADPSWEPAFGSIVKRSDKVLHNLPLPEFDETGLVGRSQDCQTIVNHLLRRRETMITITGEGGIGKTALALQVAYSVLDAPEVPYECILWVSLKTEKLTANGVETIVDAVRDVTGAVHQLGRVIVDEFAGTVSDLAEMLEGVETLLIVDNLETVDGSEIIALYEALPDSVTYLLTSRIGVGQLERRVPLGPLRERDADNLFRSFSRARGVDRMAQLKPDTVKEVVSRLRYSPLAVRWYILSVESGAQPNLLLLQQDELINFCVRSVYEKLGEVTQRLLVVLYSLERVATFDELAILTENSIDELRRAVQKLVSGSMVTVSPSPDNALISHIGLTEAARHFLTSVEPPRTAEIGQILSREQEIRKGEELRRADEAQRELAPAVVHVRGPHDEPTAHLLRMAFKISSRENFDKAREYVTKARQLNPEFWEVDRVDGFLLSTKGKIDQATAAYNSALRKAVPGKERAVVCHFLAGHLARKSHDLTAALPYAEEAHDFFGTAESGHLLGTIHLWQREYEKAQEYLVWALEEVEEKGKLYRIILTTLIDSWRRWADHLLENDLRPVEASHNSHTAFSLGVQELRKGTYDLRLAAGTLEGAKVFMRAVTVTGALNPSFEGKTYLLLRDIEAHIELFEKCQAWGQLPGHVGKIFRARNVSDRIRELCSSLAGGASSQSENLDAQEGFSGRVSGWLGRYGFITHREFPSDVFFPASVVRDLAARGEEIDLTGCQVRFDIDEYETGARPRASWVLIVSGS
ncbi:NB-ARC domain-containing protein [Streptomyces sp. NBC_01238]|uniref:NB-ARC domain-containing protein n=1 Tax=Streptomyces sp. NBC_01238 TaxID=2903791 RepID=UPI00386A88BA